MRLFGTRALALSQGLSSCPARPKSATGHGARLTVSARSGLSHAPLKADALAATPLAPRCLAGNRCHQLGSRLVIFFLNSVL